MLSLDTTDRHNGNGVTANQIGAGSEVSATIEEYCEAIYNLTHDTNKAPISAQLAERLHVTPPTVYSAVKRLVRDGYVRMDTTAKALYLTAQGEAIAVRLTRRHNLLECFLWEKLGLGWDAIHEEACRLEHVISPKVEAALDAYLNYPTICPHGNPVPGNFVVGQLSVVTPPLSEVGTATLVKIIRINEEAEHQPGLLTYLLELNLLPGTLWRVKGWTPLQDGLMLADTTGYFQMLGLKIARQIRVSIVDG
jgi:DtxR family transcriptional regulator, Mn-dependent transcriptional regulator